MRQLILVLLLCLMTAMAAPIATAQGTYRGPAKRILVVYENESTLVAAMQVAEGIRDGLRQEIPTGYEIYSEYLDIVRFPSAMRLDRLSADLANKYADVPIDLVLAIGPGALKFMLANRQRIVGQQPIVFGAVSEISHIGEPALENVTGIISHFDVLKTVELARRLQPDTRRVVVVTGSAPFDQEWQRKAREVLSTKAPDLEADYLSGLTLDQFKEQVATLPRHTILLILSIFEDADGRKFIPFEAAAEISKASSVASYSVYSTYIGTGAVAGHVNTFQSIGREMVRLAGAISVSPMDVPKIVESSGSPLVDWRLLGRWGIPESRLPPDATLRNYQLSAWQQYRYRILAAIAFMALQMLTIVALLIQHRRRRRAEQDLALERLELSHLSRTSQLGEISGALAHEINQPLMSMLANAETGQRLLNRRKLDVDELGEIFSDIARDSKHAGDVIAQLRAMISKGHAEHEIVDLNEAVKGTIALARGELLARETKLDFKPSTGRLPVKGNLPQLQQVILNLILNASDAMAGVPPSQRRINVEISLQEDESRQLSVRDRGPGLAEDVRSKIFKPFTTTKPHGLGLGLSISRNIVQSHGGTLDFVDNPAEGACIVLRLPHP